MEISSFTLVGIIALSVSEVISAYYAIKYRKLRKKVSSTETSRISDIVDGFHEIKGRVVALDEPLLSPYDEKACVFYKFKVEEYKNNGKTDWWDGLIDDEKKQRFGINDGSGLAIIDLDGANLELKSEDGFNPDVNTDMKSMSYSNRERLLKRYGVKSYDGRYERTVRYREHVLGVGVFVHVMGEVKEKDEGRPIFQGQTLHVTDQSEDELLELYTNKYAMALGFMIGIPFIPFVFWLMAL